MASDAKTVGTSIGYPSLAPLESSSSPRTSPPSLIAPFLPLQPP